MISPEAHWLAAASKIAKVVGVSRNVVVGIAYRNRNLFPGREALKSAQAKAPPGTARKDGNAGAPR